MTRALTFTLALLFASSIAAFSVQDAVAQDAAAQDARAPREDPGASRSASFEAAQGAQTEDIPGGALMIAAYGIIWLLLLAFVGSLGFRHAQTQRELARLREDLKASGELPPREP